MDSNPILHPSPAKEMKCYFLYYVQLLMISQACWWTRTTSTTCLQPKYEMLIFWLCSASDDWPGWSMDSNPICHPSSAEKNKILISLLRSTSDDQPDWSMDSNPIHHPSPAKKMKCLFLDYVHFWWSAWLIDELEPHLTPLSYQKNEMLNFRLRSTSDDQPGWPMDSNPIFQPSPAKNMKCSIFVLHLISDVGQTCQWTQTPSTTPLQPKKWNASFLDYTQLLMIGQAEWWTQTPSTIPLQPKKWNAHFWITFNFWWLAGLVDGLKPHPPPISSQ